jgi:hypothetical protein
MVAVPDVVHEGEVTVVQKSCKIKRGVVTHPPVFKPFIAMASVGNHPKLVRAGLHHCPCGFDVQRRGTMRGNPL